MSLKRTKACATSSAGALERAGASAPTRCSRSRRPSRLQGLAAYYLLAYDRLKRAENKG